MMICVSYYSVSVINHNNQGQLKEERVCAYNCKWIVNNGREGIATDCWSRKTREISRLQHQTKRVDNVTKYGLNIQIPEPMGNIQHSNKNMVCDLIMPRRKKPQSPVILLPGS